MATSTNIQNEITEALQCTICLQLLSRPRSLHCHHTYCKVCLDGLLQFIDEEGNAKIICPLRCEGSTSIAHDKTTQDLPVSHQLNCVLELLNKELKKSEDDIGRRYPCAETEECKKMVSLYCKVCSKMICHECRGKHDTKHETKKYIPIAMDEKSDNLMVVCEEHGSLADFVCCSSEFICIYCKHRSHRGHMTQTVSESAERIRLMITNPRAVLEADISRARQLLHQVLRQRRMKCIIQYIEHLNMEEEEILTAFNNNLEL